MSDEAKARYPLRAVIRRTGLSADVIRAWERRYGAVTPQRSEGGQRLYSEVDVARLVLLQRATAMGHSIGEVARLDVEALESLVRETADVGVTSAQSPDTSGFIAEAIAAAEALSAERLEHALKRAVLAVGTDRFVDEVVASFLRDVGDRWHRGALSPAHEHLASNVVRRVLGWLGDAYDTGSRAHRVIVATPAGELHELGALAVAAAAASEGWRVVYLGANLPAAHIAAAAAQVDARVVALSVINANGDQTVREVREMASALPREARVVIGGAAAANVQRLIGDAGIRLLPDIRSFRSLLRDVAGGADKENGSRPGLA